jgi:hypothetical protein
VYETQSRFVKHGPCEHCGSRNNVAWYSNGTGFCFGCSHFYRGSPASRYSETSTNEIQRGGNSKCDSDVHVRSISRKDVGSDVETGGTRSTGVRPPPDDIGTYFPAPVIQWLGQYHIVAEDLLRWNVRWSPSREQLIYLFYGEGTDVVLWQARNFREGTTHQTRYFTGGTAERVIAHYPPKQGAGETAIIVEDCASGIKLAKSGYTGIPCFGSKMSEGKLTQICNRFENVHWWLDDDMWKSAVSHSNRCKLLGVNSQVISTCYDPKTYSCDEVRDILRDPRYHHE